MVEYFVKVIHTYGWVLRQSDTYLLMGSHSEQ